MIFKGASRPATYICDETLHVTTVCHISGLQATTVTYNAALVERSGVAHFLAEVCLNLCESVCWFTGSPPSQGLKLTQDGNTKLMVLKALHTLSSSGIYIMYNYT